MNGLTYLSCQDFYLMNKYLLLWMLLSQGVFAGNKQHLELPSSHETLMFETDKGMLNGPYVSYYSSGKIKSEGSFKNNNRIGDWKLYAEDGTILVERKYTNSWSFEEIIPAPRQVQFNRDNYDILASESIYMKKRNWTELSAASDPELFQNRQDIDQVLTLLEQGGFKRYADDRFVTDISSKHFPVHTSISKIRIKKETMIDLRRFALDTRIIGIEFVSSNQLEEMSFGWFYFPDLFSIVTSNPVLERIYHNEVAGVPYKTLTGTSLTHQGEPYTVNQSAEYVQLSMIEKEHDVWKEFMLARSKD